MATCKECFFNEHCGGFLLSDLDMDVWHYCAEGRADEIPDIEERCTGFAYKDRFGWSIQNSPFQILALAFKKLFPDIEYEAFFESNIRRDAKRRKVLGLTDFGDDGKITIFVSSKLSIENATEIFAQELAHAGVGIEHDHDDEWEKAFQDLIDEYNKIGGAMFSKGDKT